MLADSVRPFAYLLIAIIGIIDLTAIAAWAAGSGIESSETDTESLFNVPVSGNPLI